MSGNHQVRFLGEDAAARPPPYPTKTGAGIHQDHGFEDFSGMDNGQREGANRHDIDADDGVFGVQATNEELFTVEASKQRPEKPRGSDRSLHGP
jgi:hypothetical protein